VFLMRIPSLGFGSAAMTSMSGSSADQEDLSFFVCYYSEVTWVVAFVKFHRFFLLRLMSFGFFTMLSAQVFY
jgi:hypothetical protein